jgi:hypothetical protein
MSDYIMGIAARALQMQVQMSYTRQTSIPRVEIPAHMDMKTLSKAIFLNNSIFQAEKASYKEKILFNDQGEWIYFYPATPETILTMDARLGQACSIVYTAIRNNQNLTKTDMEILNNRYALLKKVVWTLS